MYTCVRGRRRGWTAHGVAQQLVENGVGQLDVECLQLPEVASLVRWAGQLAPRLELVRARGALKGPTPTRG